MMAERPDGARPGSLPPAVRALRHAPARIFHPLRRRAAAARLARRGLPASILFVCHGNICRSPLAAALLRRALSQKKVGVGSAGFMCPERPAPPAAVAAAAHYGVERSCHRPQHLMADHAPRVDLLLVVDASRR